ncbi:MAG: extracellular solute-binding protein, partial [Lentisphaeria bacterium]|nr:extracellular solute-binding protein [Lentisphaeria bacterium]
MNWKNIWQHGLIKTAGIMIAAVFLLALMIRGITFLLPSNGDEALTTVPQQMTAKKRIPLRLQRVPDPRLTSPRNKAEQAVFQAFLKKHPEVEVSAFSGITIANIQAESEIMLAIAGGNAPDVFTYINFRMSDSYIQQSFLYPLDGFLDRDRFEGGRDAYLNSLAKPIRPVVKRNGPAIGDNAAGEHIWAMPGPLAVRVLMWRKDLFQEAGLDPERPPQDWEELLSYAKNLS